MLSRLEKFCRDSLGVSVNHDDDPSHEFVTQQTLQVALMVGFCVSVLGASLYAPISTRLSWIHLFGAGAFIATYGFYRLNGNSRLAARLGSTCAFVTIALVNYAYGGVSSPAITWFVLPAAASALIIGWRDGWFWIACGCVAASILYYLEWAGGLPPIDFSPSIMTLVAFLYSLVFALVFGVLVTFWVARHQVIEAELNTMVAKSTYDAGVSQLLAESAIAANGSLDFEQAAPLCLRLVCEAREWAAAQIWQRDADGALSSVMWHIANPAYAAIKDVSPIASGSKESAVAIAMQTATPIPRPDITVIDDQSRSIDERSLCALAWPVEVDGDIGLVLEFFSAKPIVVDSELKTFLRHIAVQLSHVRIRELMHARTQIVAYTDVITGLPNRAGFERLFADKLAQAKRKKTQLALMFVDLDGFKRINDSLGHITGDRLLKEIGSRIATHTRESDLAARLGSSNNLVAARLGGDEFTFVLSEVSDREGVENVANRFLDILSVPIDVGFQDVNVGASIGIALYPQNGKNLSDLMRMADAAMYEAKAIPGNQFQFATPKLNDAIQRRLWIESELSLALRNDDLKIHFAPIAAALNGKIVGNEVILRWPHRDGEIPFREFLAVAENSALVGELGYWVLRETCAAIANQVWGDQPQAKVAVDISLLHLQQTNFLADVRGLIEEFRIPMNVLEFEFSDTSTILRNESCRENIRELHKIGVRIVLDRFGNGYSSLSDFADLPIWRVKMDRRFVERVNFAEGNRSMGRAIIAMAHSMGIETTIFGVLTEQHANELRQLGCDALQGEWVGRLSDTPCAPRGKRQSKVELSSTETQLTALH